jgi:hypothetical protein
MKTIFTVLMSILSLSSFLSVSSAHAAGSKGIQCWAVEVEAQSMRYLFNQASAIEPGRPLASSMQTAVGPLVFSAGFVPGGDTQPSLSLSILDQQTGLKISSSQSKLGFGSIEANSYEQIVYENTKTGSQTVFTCKVVQDGVGLPGSTN